jgi:hypothetical protein
MDPNSGKLYPVADDETARKLGLVPVSRKLTPIEKGRMQIALYSPCACGSGKKLKFCCYKKATA